MEYGWPAAHYDAQNTGRTDSSVPTSPDTSWTFDAQGTITTAPIVEYGMAYLMVLEDKTTYLVALDAETGVQAWRYEIPSFGICETTPCAYMDSIYFPAVFRIYDSREGQYYFEYYLLCIDAHTGERRWYVPLAGFPQIGSSPVPYEGTILLGEGYQGTGHVECFDADDGTQLWFADVMGEALHTVSVMDGTAYASTYAGRIYALHVSTGEITGQWDIFEPAAMGPTTAFGTYVYVNGISLELKEQGFGGGQLVALDRESGDIIWVYGESDDTSISHCSISSTLAFFSTYSSDGAASIACVRLTDGTLRWSQDTDGAVMGGSLSVGKNAVVLCDSESGTVLCFGLTDGTSLWEFDTGDTAPFTPALADGKVYVASENELYCIG